VAEEDDTSNREEELALGQSEEEESSTIASEMDEGEEESTFDFQRGEPLEEDEDAESHPTASAHRKALELLGRFLISLTKSTKVEFGSLKKILDGIAGETDEVKVQLGNLYDLV